ncbi:MAG: hypothetical protein ACOCRK_11075 [bacterium]
MKIEQGKYQIFVVGDEKIVSDSREKIKKYAKEKGIEKIEYKMSVNNLEGIKDSKEYKKI